MHRKATVETKFLRVATPEKPLELFNGERLTDVTLAYETYGKLNANRSNAVLVFHALSGSAHAAGYNPEVPGVDNRWTDECKIGWWDGFIGPGKSVDTDHFFVICANYIGGCYGSTGPCSINPATGRRWGRSFPHITLSDIVDSQIRLLDHLGIEQLHAVMGASLGGMLSLSLATRYPDRVRTVIPCASGLLVPILTRIHNFEQIYAIESDPDFKGGDYDPLHQPRRGMALARMIGHKTFVSLDAMAERARKEIVRRSADLSWYDLTSPIESYMLHQGAKFVQRFDANTYLRILDAWNRFDIVREGVAEDLVSLFERCRQQKFLVFTIDTDVCYWPEEQEHMVKTLKKAGIEPTWITVHSDKGHDSFLLEPHLYRPFLRAALMD
ncbi:homoserine O-acetyltransferase [Fontisphaera persica]|uniref:homoserine O-acetyltransferase MetX n=1 Tax=Fontisphaera persica TaxID=2974023 RepID=UPI0024BF8991|nr:homoserine O-acetyltransferase [Fontisphaera persica]WCJ59180.1 homoserine O-acetyltransferase [Fontisphaera persica]